VTGGLRVRSRSMRTTRRRRRLWLAVAVCAGAVGVCGAAAAAAPGERIPAGVHEIDVTRGRPGHAPSMSLAVTSAGKVARIVALIDDLPAVKPGLVLPCPMLPANAPVVTLTFRASRGGSVLAQATQIVMAGPVTPCVATHLHIGGHAQRALLGGEPLLAKIGEALGVKLTGSA
jgi:hypothetical protein